MNQIFLGNRAYGFAAASETYFGKPLKDISIAEAAMLAGLPKAPSAYNPISNPKRARSRQLHIIDRMLENGFITRGKRKLPKQKSCRSRSGPNTTQVHAEYVAEMVRQYGFHAVRRRDLHPRAQRATPPFARPSRTAAYRALRRGIMDFERRQVYRGPEKFIALSDESRPSDEAIDDALEEHPDNGDMHVGRCAGAQTPRRLLAVRQNSERLEIVGDGLKPAQSGLSDKAPPTIKIRRGCRDPGRQDCQGHLGDNPAA